MPFQPMSKCECIQLTANKKGFGLGKAVVGGVLLGPAGLLGGFVGSGKVRVTCLTYAIHGRQANDNLCLSWRMRSFRSNGIATPPGAGRAYS